MASSSELRDVFELPARPAPRPVVKKLKTDSGKRMDGMQRELYSLLGENTPPISMVQNKFKDKPSWKQAVAPWKWSPFTNSAREDGLVLHHWVRGAHPDSDDYSFAKLDQKIRIPSFTKTDYSDINQSDGWTYDEVRYLFNLCQDYDLRWIVIHDRYNYRPGLTSEDVKTGSEDATIKDETDGRDEENKESEVNDEMEVETGEEESKAEEAAEGEDKGAGETDAPTERTLEDLKDQFYTVCRELLKLQQKRSGSTLSPAEEDLYKQMKYSKENEIKRKLHLERLLSRSPAEVAEEEALIIESRKLEAAAERMLSERGELLRMLDAPQSSGSISQYQTSQGLAQLTSTLMTTDKTKKRKEPSDSGSATPIAAPTAAVAAPAAASGPSVSTPKSTQPTLSKAEQGKKNSAATIAQIIQKKLTAKEEAVYGISYHDRLSAGVYARSTKIPTLKSTIQSKVQGVLTELGLPTRPTMVTAKVSAKFESLQQSIGVLLEAKRQRDKLETEVSVLRAQKEGE